MVSFMHSSDPRILQDETENTDTRQLTQLVDASTEDTVAVAILRTPAWDELMASYWSRFGLIQILRTHSILPEALLRAAIEMPVVRHLDNPDLHQQTYFRVGGVPRRQVMELIRKLRRFRLDVWVL